MSRITWDQVGERGFEVGVDRGVFYSPHELVTVDSVTYSTGFPWNGLKTVEVTPINIGTTPLYVDGRKTIDLYTPGDFSAKITAFTYPDEFLAFDGFAEAVPGFFVDNQSSDAFGLCYRTLIGNDVDGALSGYKLHILYNLIAIPDPVGHQTVDSNIIPIEFAWSINATPVEIPGYRPTAHIVVDSTKVPSDGLSDLEDVLYGTDSTLPRLPTALQALAFVGVIVIDNGDGSWSAAGPDSLVTMLDDNTFQIDWDKAIYLDADTYTIS